MILLFACVSLLISCFMRWWCLVLFCFLFSCYFRLTRAKIAVLAAVVGMLWIVLALFFDHQSSWLVSERMAALFGGIHPLWIYIMTGLTGTWMTFWALYLGRRTHYLKVRLAKR